MNREMGSSGKIMFFSINMSVGVLDLFLFNVRILLKISTSWTVGTGLKVDWEIDEEKLRGGHGKQ